MQRTEESSALISALQEKTTEERTGGTVLLPAVAAEGRDLSGPRSHTEFLPLRKGRLLL